MIGLRTKSLGLLLGWAAVAVWFGATAFHHALHPHHAHGHGDVAASHDHAHAGHCSSHAPAPPAPAGDDGLHDGQHVHLDAHHNCGLCVLASSASLQAPDGQPKARWYVRSSSVPVLPSSPAHTLEYLPQTRRGPPSLA